jgi:hypothetical protein
LPSSENPPPEVVEYARRHMKKEAERRRKFGNVRPVITTVHQGHRFVVVGSRLYFHENWRTFTDFLLFYVRDVMGKEWWEAESAKPAQERHVIVRCDSFNSCAQPSRRRRRRKRWRDDKRRIPTRHALLQATWD